MHDTTALDPLVKEYQKVTRQLEDLLDEYIGRKKQLKKIKRKKVTQMLLFADENLQSSQKG